MHTNTVGNTLKKTSSDSVDRRDVVSRMSMGAWELLFMWLSSGFVLFLMSCSYVTYYLKLVVCNRFETYFKSPEKNYSRCYTFAIFEIKMQKIAMIKINLKNGGGSFYNSLSLSDCQMEKTVKLRNGSYILSCTVLRTLRTFLSRVSSLRLCLNRCDLFNMLVHNLPVFWLFLFDIGRPLFRPLLKGQ